MFLSDTERPLTTNPRKSHFTNLPFPPHQHSFKTPNRPHPLYLYLVQLSWVELFRVLFLSFLLLSNTFEMARKKIREYDSKRLLKEHLKRIAGIQLEIRSAQVQISTVRSTFVPFLLFYVHRIRISVWNSVHLSLSLSVFLTRCYCWWSIWTVGTWSTGLGDFTDIDSESLICCDQWSGSPYDVVDVNLHFRFNKERNDFRYKWQYC